MVSTRCERPFGFQFFCKVVQWVFGGGLFVWWCLTIASRLVSWRGLRIRRAVSGGHLLVPHALVQAGEVVSSGVRAHHLERARRLGGADGVRHAHQNERPLRPNFTLCRNQLLRKLCWCWRCGCAVCRSSVETIVTKTTYSLRKYKYQYVRICTSDTPTCKFCRSFCSISLYRIIETYSNLF